MQKIWTIAPVIAAALIATPAAAQATRTWVSGVGDDANPCSRTAPCKTFQGAISKTAANGEINALDPGGFGAVTITKSITIRAVGIEAGISVSGSNGITVNAGVNDRVILEGLDIDGLGTGTIGARVVAGRDIIIRDSKIHNFTMAGVTAEVGSGKTFLTIADSQIIGNGYGVQITSPSGRTRGYLVNSLSTANVNGAIQVSGTGNTVLISNNQLLDFSRGLEVVSGGTATSSGDNTIASPVSDSATIVPKG